MTRRTTTLATPALAVVALAACGGTHYQYTPRPTVPLNVSVYINSQRVSLSPDSITPGPTTITITNQASTAESVQVAAAGASASNSLAETGPISPQGTAQVTVDLNSAGNYTVTTAPANSTEAAAATPTGILPGLLRVQGERPLSTQPQSP